MKASTKTQAAQSFWLAPRISSILETGKKALGSVLEGLTSASRAVRGVLWGPEVAEADAPETEAHRRARERDEAPPVTEPERHGAARDARSFEQRRRGGPVTGEADPKAKGPRHTGGGKRRGRNDSQIDEAFEVSLPIEDYDELAVSEIEERLSVLHADSLRTLLDYETSNKHREHVVASLQRTLEARV